MNIETIQIFNVLTLSTFLEDFKNLEIILMT